MDSLEDYARRLTRLEREMALNSSRRRLSQTSIGGGGLRVHGGGTITIEQGGHLIIEDGDLVLGHGVIEGAALKSQVETTFLEKRTRVNGSTRWETGAEVTVKVPEWASKTIVQMSGNALIFTRGEVRARIDTQQSIPLDAKEWKEGYDGRYTQSVAWAGEVPKKQEFTCSFDMRELGGGFPTGTTGNRLEISVMAVHYR